MWCLFIHIQISRKYVKIWILFTLRIIALIVLPKLGNELPRSRLDKPRALQCKHKRRYEHYLQNYAEHGFDEDGICKYRKRKSIAAEAHDDVFHGAPDYPAGKHGANERNIDINRLFRQAAIEQPDDKPVNAKLKSHGKSRREEWRSRYDNRTQNRRRKTDSRTPCAAAGKTAEKHGNMHEAKCISERDIVSREKREQYAKGERNAGKGEFFDIFILHMIT